MGFGKTPARVKSRKAQALQYAARGFRVVRMHPVRDGRCACAEGKACNRPGKHPSTPHGVKDATLDRGRIKSWCTASPNANVGIAANRASSCWTSIRETAA